MRTKRLIYILGAAIVLVSCARSEYDPVPMDSLLRDSLETTYTIAELKSEFMTEFDAYSDPVNKNIGLFTADLIDADEDVVISGYVTSSDTEGNMYKYFVVQEDKPNGRAMRVSVDVSGLSAEFPLGQRVFIRCNGLYIGNYGQSPQLGSLYRNESRFKVFGKDTVYRVEPGRMPVYMAREHIVSYGMPEPHKVKADTMTIQEILAKPRTEMDHRLVCIKGAKFTGKGYDFNQPVNLKEADKIFAPGTNGIGFPQSREITDGTGSLPIASSEYARFAQKPLPESSYVGDITVVVSWYKDRIDRDGNYQLTLRTLSDLGADFDDYLKSVEYERKY